MLGISRAEAGTSSSSSSTLSRDNKLSRLKDVTISKVGHQSLKKIEKKRMPLAPEQNAQALRHTRCHLGEAAYRAFHGVLHRFSKHPLLCPVNYEVIGTLRIIPRRF